MSCAPQSLLDAQEDSFEPQPDDPNSYPDAPEGSCTSWKYAYCDAIAACSAFVSREQCELDLGWLECLSDAPLEKCEAKIRKALDDEDCDALPQDCGPKTIADRTKPTQLCEEIHAEMCEFRFFCGLEFSSDACMETLSLTEPCEKFTSFVPTAVECSEAYSKLGCEEPMPRVCAGALRY